MSGEGPARAVSRCVENAAHEDHCENALTPSLSRRTGEGDRMSGEGKLLVTVHATPRRVNGREKMQDFSIESIAGRLRDFYEEVLGAARASRVPVGAPPTEA